jgi:hypothetical protein
VDVTMRLLLIFPRRRMDARGDGISTCHTPSLVIETGVVVAGASSGRSLSPSG